jgi:predicted transcriptional regulator
MSTHTVEKPRQCGVSAEDIESLPPSAKLVLESLHRTDGQTTSELAAEADLAERTIRYALTQLDELGIIESRYLLSDPQTRKYMLTPADQQIADLLER